MEVARVEHHAAYCRGATVRREASPACTPHNAPNRTASSWTPRRYPSPAFRVLGPLELPAPDTRRPRVPVTRSVIVALGHAASPRLPWRGDWIGPSRHASVFGCTGSRHGTAAAEHFTDTAVNPLVGRPCCGRGAGAPSSFSLFVIRVRPAPEAHSSKMRRTTAASAS